MICHRGITECEWREMAQAGCPGVSMAAYSVISLVQHASPLHLRFFYTFAQWSHNVSSFLKLKELCKNGTTVRARVVLQEHIIVIIAPLFFRIKPKPNPCAHINLVVFLGFFF